VDLTFFQDNKPRFVEIEYQNVIVFAENCFSYRMI
jgi:hypothetical protein